MSVVRFSCYLLQRNLVYTIKLGYQWKVVISIVFCISNQTPNLRKRSGYVGTFTMSNELGFYSRFRECVPQLSVESYIHSTCILQKLNKQMLVFSGE